MTIELIIPFDNIPFDKNDLFDFSIDYADNTLRGVLKNYNFNYKEIILLNLSNYGISLDNRFGNGYDIVRNDNNLIIQFRKK